MLRTHVLPPLWVSRSCFLPVTAPGAVGGDGVRFDGEQLARGIARRDQPRQVQRGPTEA
jgi:hypothetical protein